MLDKGSLSDHSTNVPPLPASHLASINASIFDGAAHVTGNLLARVLLLLGYKIICKNIIYLKILIISTTAFVSQYSRYFIY